jgi:hypothetical protein
MAWPGLRRYVVSLEKDWPGLPCQGRVLIDHRCPEVDCLVLVEVEQANKQRMRLLFALVVTGAYAAVDTANFTLSLKPLARVPPRFIGFSIEVSSAPEVFLVGGLGGGPRRSFATLMNGLRSAAGESAGPTVRVGGNSADTSAWVPAPAPLPPNSTYRITSADLAAYAAAIPAFNGSVIVDVTLRYPSQPVYDVEHVTAAAAALGGALSAVEIGNEPDLFHKNGIRQPGYDYAQYKVDYNNVSVPVLSALAGSAARVQGATWCSDTWSPADFADYIDAAKQGLSCVSLHRYAASVCDGGKATIAELMADKASQGLAAGLEPWVAVADAAGVPLVIGEGNSVSCGGATGVSDTWAAALWALDTLFNVAAVGVHRWAFHGMPHGPYATVQWVNVTQDLAEVAPLYYGLLAFATAAGHESTILSLDSASSSNPFIKCWAVVDANSETRVVVLHKDPSAEANATVAITPAASLTATGSLVRGLPGAEGLASKWNSLISLGGQTWSTTSDGTPAGTPVSETVPVDGQGRFVFELPPASFVIFTLPGK